MSITLPEFLFKEFVEGDEVEIPNLIKDDGFRKSIVTATGEHRANLFQFQRTRGIKVSDNSSPRTPPPGDFVDLLNEEYDDEVFESPSKSSCASASTVINNSNNEVMAKSTKSCPKSTDGSVYFHEEEDFYTDECDVLTTRGEIRPLLVKKTRGRIRLESSDHHTGCKLLSKSPASSKSTNSSSSGAYTSAESVTPTKTDKIGFGIGVQKYSPLALDDFGYYSNVLDCKNQSSESVGMKSSKGEPSPVDLEILQEHFLKKGYDNNSEEYPLEYEDQFRRQVIPENDLRKKAIIESQSGKQVEKKDKATDTEDDEDGDEEMGDDFSPKPSEEVFKIEKVVCDWVIPQSKRERREKEEKRKSQRKVAEVFIDTQPLSAELADPLSQKEYFFESKDTNHKARSDTIRSILLKDELRSMKEKADKVAKELKSVVNSIRSPNDSSSICKPFTTQEPGVSLSSSLPSLKKISPLSLQLKTSASFATLESLRSTNSVTSPFAPQRKSITLLKTQSSKQSVSSNSSSVGTLVSNSTSHLADENDKMEFQVEEVSGSEEQNAVGKMDLALPDINEVLMNSDDVKISSLASKYCSKEKHFDPTNISANYETIYTVDSPKHAPFMPLEELKTETMSQQVHKDSVFKNNEIETETAPSTPVATSPQQISKPPSPFFKNLDSILSSLPVTPPERAVEGKIPIITVTPPSVNEDTVQAMQFQFEHTLSSVTVTPTLDANKSKTSQFEQGVTSMATITPLSPPEDVATTLETLEHEVASTTTITPASPPLKNKDGDASFTTVSQFEQGVFPTATITPRGSPPPAQVPAKAQKSREGKLQGTNFLLTVPPMDKKDIVVPTFKTPGSPPPIPAPLRHLSPSPFDFDGSVIRFTFSSVQRVLPTVIITPPSPCQEQTKEEVSTPQSKILQKGKGSLPTILLTPPSPAFGDKDIVATISVDCITQHSQFKVESPSKESTKTSFSFPSVDTGGEAARPQSSPQGGKQVSQLSLSSVDLRSLNSPSVHSSATPDSKDSLAPMPQVLIRWDRGIIPALVMTPPTPPNDSGKIVSNLEAVKAGRTVKSISEHTYNCPPNYYSNICTSDGKLAEEDVQFFTKISTQTDKPQDLSNVQVDTCLALASIPTPSPHYLGVRSTNPEIFKFTPETYNSIPISKKDLTDRSSLITSRGLSKSAPCLRMGRYKVPSLEDNFVKNLEEFEADSLNSIPSPDAVSVPVSGDVRRSPHLSTPVGVSFAPPPKWDTGAKPAKSDHNTPNASSPNQVFKFEPAFSGAALEFDDHSTSLPSLGKDSGTCPIIILNSQPMASPEDDGYSFSVPFKPLLNLPESPNFRTLETSSSATSTSEYSANIDSLRSSKKGGSLSSQGSNTPKENSDGNNRRSSMSTGRSTSRKSVQFALSTKPVSTSSSEKNSINSSSLAHFEDLRSQAEDSPSYSLKNNCSSPACSSGETSSFASVDHSPRLYKSERDYKLAKKLQRYELLSSSAESFQSSNNSLDPMLLSEVVHYSSPGALIERGPPLSVRVEFRDSVPSLRSSLFAGKRKSEFTTRESSQKAIGEGYSFDGAEQECASLCSAVPRNVEALLQGRDFSPVVYEKTIHDIDSPGANSNRNTNSDVDSVATFEYEDLSLSEHTDRAVHMTASSMEGELSSESVEPYYLHERDSAYDSVEGKNAGTDSGPSVESYLLPLEHQFPTFSTAKRCESTTSRSAPSVMSSPEQSKASLPEKTSSPSMEKIGDLIVTFKCERANSAPSIQSFRSMHQPSCPAHRPSVYFRPSVKLENAIATAVDLKHGLEATIAILSSTARSNTLHRRFSSTAIDSPLQCPPPPPTPVSSENLIPAKITMNEKQKYAEIDSAHKKYLKMLSTATPLMQRILTTSGWPAVAFLLEEPIEPYSSEAPEWFQAIQRQGDPRPISPPISKRLKEGDVGKPPSVNQELPESISNPPSATVANEPEASLPSIIVLEEAEGVGKPSLVTVTKHSHETINKPQSETHEAVNKCTATMESEVTSKLPPVSAMNEPEPMKLSFEKEAHEGGINPPPNVTTGEPINVTALSTSGTVNETQKSNPSMPFSVTDRPKTIKFDEPSSQDDGTSITLELVTEVPRTHLTNVIDQDPANPQPQTQYTSNSILGEMVVGQTRKISSKQATLIDGNEVLNQPAYQDPHLPVTQEPQVNILSGKAAVSQEAPLIPQSDAKEPQGSANTVTGKIPRFVTEEPYDNGVVISQQQPSVPQSTVKELQANDMVSASTVTSHQQYPSMPQADMVTAAVTGQRYPSVPQSATKEPQVNFITIGQQYPAMPQSVVDKQPETNTVRVNTMTGQRYHSMPQPVTKAPQVNTMNVNTHKAYQSLPTTDDHQAPSATGQSFGGVAEQQAPTHFQFPSAFSNYAPQVSTVNTPELFTNIPVHCSPTGMYNEMRFHQTSISNAKDSRGSGDAFATQSHVDYAELEAVYPPPASTSTPGFSFTEINNLTKVSTQAAGDKKKVTSLPKKKLNTRRSLSQRAKFLQSHLVNYSDTSESEASTSKTKLTHSGKMSNAKDCNKKEHADGKKDTKCTKVDSDNDRLFTLVSDCYYSGSQTSSELELASTKSHQHASDEEKEKPTDELNILEKNAKSDGGISHNEYSGNEASPASIKSYLATNGTSYSRLLSEASTSECSIDMQKSFDGSMADIISVTDNFLSYMSSLGASSDDVGKPVDDGVMTEPVASSSNPESQATFYSHDTHSTYVSNGMCPATHCIPADKNRSATSILPQKIKVPEPEVNSAYIAPPTLTPSETEGAEINLLPPGETDKSSVPSTSSEMEGENESKPLKLRLLVPPKREGADLKRDHRILPPKLKLVATENKSKGSKHSGEKKATRKLTKTSSAGGVPTGKTGAPQGKVSHPAAIAVPKAASDGGVEVKSDEVSTPISAMSTEDGIFMDIASPASVTMKKQRKKRKAHRIKRFLNSLF